MNWCIRCIYDYTKNQRDHKTTEEWIGRTAHFYTCASLVRTTLTVYTYSYIAAIMLQNLFIGVFVWISENVGKCQANCNHANSLTSMVVSDQEAEVFVFFVHLSMVVALQNEGLSQELIIKVCTLCPLRPRTFVFPPFFPRDYSTLKKAAKLDRRKWKAFVACNSFIAFFKQLSHAIVWNALVDNRNITSF